MDAASIISLIVIGAVAVFTSITAPLILAHRTERMHREDKLEEYRRQDEVARKAAQAAADLVASQKQIADQAAEAATLLLAANERVAATARVTNSKLDTIHGLVNSSMTAAMHSELDALVTSLALMHEVMDMKRTAKSEPTAEALLAVRTTEAKISELRAVINDRLQQTETAGQVKEEGAGG